MDYLFAPQKNANLCTTDANLNELYNLKKNKHILKSKLTRQQKASFFGGIFFSFFSTCNIYFIFSLKINIPIYGTLIYIYIYINKTYLIPLEVSVVQKLAVWFSVTIKHPYFLSCTQCSGQSHDIKNGFFKTEAYQCKQ